MLREEGNVSVKEYNVFDPDQVVKLFIHQQDQARHPYTCAYRNDGNHRVIMGDLGVLMPTIHGWICPFCNYTQDWAHGMMSDG